MVRMTSTCYDGCSLLSDSVYLRDKESPARFSVDRSRLPGDLTGEITSGMRSSVHDPSANVRRINDSRTITDERAIADESQSHTTDVQPDKTLLSSVAGQFSLPRFQSGGKDGQDPTSSASSITRAFFGSQSAEVTSDNVSQHVVSRASPTQTGVPSSRSVDDAGSDSPSSTCTSELFSSDDEVPIGYHGSWSPVTSTGDRDIDEYPCAIDSTPSTIGTTLLDGSPGTLPMSMVIPDTAWEEAKLTVPFFGRMANSLDVLVEG